MLFLLPGRDRSQDDRLCRTGRYSRWALRVLGIRVVLRGTMSVQQSGLMVSNHLSWIDPLILFALKPVTFVTSREVEATPVLGWICKRAGCLFVERRGMRAVTNDRDRLAQAMQTGVVVVFPEATSTNGKTVLPFKPAFFESARQASAAVTPLAMRYRLVNERSLTDRSRDLVHWYGDMGFPGHLGKLLLVRSVEVGVYVYQQLSWPADCNRKHMAQRTAHAVMAGVEKLAA